MAFQKIKSFLFNFFHFNKQERNGVFVLCIIIVILFGIKIVMPILTEDHRPIQLITIHPSSEYQKTEKQKLRLNPTPFQSKTSNQRFVFNPNTISEEDAIKLGLSKKLSATLINFRNKGGKFFKPEDLKKLYGLSPQLYHELEPYILISDFKRNSANTKQKVYEKKTFRKELVEINSADSLSIVYLNGIGPAFTKRIIKYRNMLGGFHSTNQLKEVYGMTDSTFTLLSSQIKLDMNAIIKIPINAIDFNSLRKHPYFNFQSAQAIINYRSKHGKLTETTFRDLGLFSNEKLDLILPYLSY